MPLDYRTVGQTLSAQRRVADKYSLVLEARGIRQERTGVHARLAVLCNGAVLAWSNFNVEKDEERVRLTNSAYTHFERRDGSGKSVGLADYPKTYLKNDLDQFCGGLWDAFLEQSMPEEMRGTETATRPAFLLQPFILSEGGTIIFAPPGRGKSYTLMLMAVSVDSGVTEVWPTSMSKVLFVNLERGARSVAARLGNVNDALALDRGRALATINARGKSLVDVAAAAERYIAEHEVRCVFVDSISRAGAGNLNDNQDVNKICDLLNRMGPAWVGLAHTPRSDESHLYGGVHFEAAADIVVQLLSEQEEDGPLGIGLQITKQNDIGKWPLWIGALEFNQLGLSGVRKARAGEFPEVEQGKRRTMRETVREHLLDVGAQDVYELSEATGFSRSKLAGLLSSDPSFIKTGKVGKRQLYAVSEMG